MVLTLIALLAAGGCGYFVALRQAIAAIVCALIALVLVFGID